MNHSYKTFKPAFTFILCMLCTRYAYTQQAHFIKKENQVFVHSDNGILLLQPFSDSIIRVAFAAGDTIPVKNEIAVIKAPQKVDYKVYEKNGEIFLQTKVITARVGVSGVVIYERVIIPLGTLNLVTNGRSVKTIARPPSAEPALIQHPRRQFCHLHKLPRIILMTAEIKS